MEQEACWFEQLNGFCPDCHQDQVGALFSQKTIKNCNAGRLFGILCQVCTSLAKGAKQVFSATADLHKTAQSSARSTQNSIPAQPKNKASDRKRLMAALRMAHKVLGLKRKGLGFGFSGFSSFGKIAVASGIALASLQMMAVAVQAQAIGSGTIEGTDSSDTTAISDPRCRIGANAKSGDGSGVGPTIAIGCNSKAWNAGVAVGSSSYASSVSVAIGGGARASENGTAIGWDADAGFQNGTAIGSGARVKANYGVALGRGSSTGSAVISTDAYVINGKTYNFANDKVLGEVAIGGMQGKSVFTRTLTGLAAGRISATSTDAVNGSQLFAVTSAYDEAMDRMVVYDGNNGDPKTSITLKGTAGTKISNLAAGTLSAASTDAVNGSQLFATNNSITTLSGTVTTVNNNLTNLTTNINSGKIGPVQRSGTNILALVAAGGSSTAPGAAQKITNLAAGTLSAASTDAVNGSQLFATNNNITKITGDITTITGNVTTIGNNLTNLTTNINSGKIGPVQRSGTNILALVAAGGSSTAPGAVQKITNLAAGTLSAASTDAVNGAQLWATEQKITSTVGDLSDRAVVYDGAKGAAKDSITLAGTSGTKITNLKAGTLSAASTDAVNGSQLFATNANITKIGTNTSTYLGGGADVINGKAPTYTVQGKTHNNVGSALGGVDTALTTINGDITNLTTNINSGKIGPVQRSGTNILALVAAGGSSTAPGAVQKITNLAAGTLSAASTDAVNGAQLWATEQKITSTVGDLSDRAVVYDGAKGAAKDSITLAGTSGTKITNLKAGTLSAASTDAVNGSQLFATNANITKIGTNTSTYLGGGADVINGKAPTYTVQGKTHNNVGSALGGVDTALTMINGDITNLTKNINDGKSGPVQRSGTDALSLLAVGGTASTPGNAQKLTNLAAGTVSSASKDAVNGAQIYANQKSIVDHLGKGASVDGNGTITGPTYTVQTKNYNTIYDAFTGVDGEITNISNKLSGVLGDALMWDKTAGAFSAMHDDGKGGKAMSKITYLANGSIASSSNDAINGSQIYGLSKSIADHFGGGASVNADGSIKAPSYTLASIDSSGKVGSSTYNNVGDALGGLDVNVKNVNTRVNNIDNSIADLKGDALMWDKTAGAFSALHDDGKGGKAKSKITNLADGSLLSNSTDAITGGQMASNNQQIAAYFGAGAGFNNGVWTAPNFKYQTVDSSGKIQNGTANNVGDALASLGSGVANVNNRVDNVENKVNNLGNNSLQYDPATGSYNASRDGKDTKITGVENGNIAKDSKDAVNGGQLWDTNQRVGDLEIKTGELADGAVMYDKDSSGNKMNSVTLQGGDPSAPVSLKNVADGKIETGSKDAVNGGQLHDYTQEQVNIVYDNSKKYTDQRVQETVQEANNYTDMKFGQLSQNVHEVRKEARQAAAIGLAAASLRYDDTPGKFSVALGSGFWKSEGAFAVGAGYTSEDGRFRTNLTGTMAGQDFGVGAGLSITLN